MKTQKMCCVRLQEVVLTKNAGTLLEHMKLGEILSFKDPDMFGTSLKMNFLCTQAMVNSTTDGVYEDQFAFFQVTRIRSPEEHLTSDMMVDTSFVPALMRGWSKDEDYRLWQICHDADPTEQKHWDPVAASSELGKEPSETIARAKYLQQNYQITSASPGFKYGRLIFPTELQQRCEVPFKTALELRLRRRNSQKEFSGVMVVVDRMLQERDAVQQAGPPSAPDEPVPGGATDGPADTPDEEIGQPIPKTRILCGFNIGGRFCGRAVWEDNIENDIEHYLAAIVHSARSRVNSYDLEELAEEYQRERCYVGDYKGCPGFIAKMIVYLLNSKRRDDDYIEAMYMDPHRRKKARGFLLHKYSHVLSIHTVSEQQQNKDLGHQEGAMFSNHEKIIGKLCLLKNDGDATMQMQKKLKGQRKQLKQMQVKMDRIAEGANFLLSANNLPIIDVSADIPTFGGSSESEEEDCGISGRVVTQIKKVTAVTSAAAAFQAKAPTLSSRPHGSQNGHGHGNGHGDGLGDGLSHARPAGVGSSEPSLADQIQLKKLRTEAQGKPAGGVSGPLLSATPRSSGGPRTARTFEIEEVSAPEKAAGSTVGALFDAVDTNGNGTISLSELTTFWNQRCRAAKNDPVESDRTLREIKELFVQLDEDHTGTLDRDEFQALMETMAEGTWEEEVDPTTGRVYYMNLETNSTQWTEPGPSEADIWLNQKLPPLATSQMGGTSARTWANQSATH